MQPYNQIALTILIIIIFFFVLPFRSQGPYKGRVVDFKTGAPIVGVPVIGEWMRAIPAPGDGFEACSKAMEFITNQKGEFEFPKQRQAIFSTLRKIRISI